MRENEAEAFSGKRIAAASGQANVHTSTLAWPFPPARKASGLDGRVVSSAGYPTLVLLCGTYSRLSPTLS
jgi:hypothetical protein